MNAKEKAKIADAKVRELRLPPYSETDVLEGEECRLGLKLSHTQWYRIAPTLPVTYLGDNTPRYIWGQVLRKLLEWGHNVVSAA